MRATKKEEPWCRILKPLKVNEKVRIQDPVSKKWDKIVSIKEVHGRNYAMKRSNGRIVKRNRGHFRGVYGEPVEYEKGGEV